MVVPLSNRPTLDAVRRMDDPAAVGYLYRLAHNLAVDFLRKQAVRERYARQLEASRVIRLPVTPEQRLLQQERRRLVQAALGELTERQRTCLELRACGLSYEEIAAVIDGNPESVGPTLTRALRKFRCAYQRLEGEGLARRADAHAE